MSPRGRSCWVLAALVLSAGMGRAEERKSEIAVEVKYISLGNECAERLRQSHLLGSVKHGKDLVFLNEHEVRLFMELLQNDIRSNVMQAPKMTMDDGQSTTFQVLDKQYIPKGATIVLTDYGINWDHHYESVSLGVQLSLRSKIAADRRSCQIDLDTQLTNLDEREPSRFSIKLLDKREKNEVGTKYDFDQPRVVKMGIKRTLTIPVGKSAVLSAGMRINQVRETVGPECLKEIPLLRELFCTTESHPEVEHLLVMVTPYVIVPHEKEERKTHKKTVDAPIIRPCRCDADTSDFRTPILPPIRESYPACMEYPDEARILRALPKPAQWPGVYEETRENIQCVTERIVDKIDPPRFFPLIGPAQLHHCRWKCSVYYMETVAGNYPVSFRWTQPQKQDVFIDLDHLHFVANDKQAGK